MAEAEVDAAAGGGGTDAEVDAAAGGCGTDAEVDAAAGGGGTETEVDAAAGGGGTDAEVNAAAGGGGTDAEVDAAAGGGGTDAEADAAAGGGGTDAEADAAAGGGGTEAEVDAAAGGGGTDAEVDAAAGGGGTEAEVDAAAGGGGTENEVDAAVGGGGAGCRGRGSNTSLLCLGFFTEPAGINNLTGLLTITVLWFGDKKLLRGESSPVGVNGTGCGGLVEAGSAGSTAFLLSGVTCSNILNGGQRNGMSIVADVVDGSTVKVAGSRPDEAGCWLVFCGSRASNAVTLL